MRRSFSAHLALAAPWFAYNVQWGGLLPVVIPAQVAVLVPHGKELALGLVMVAGALVALVATPVAGALSDRSRHGRGPFVAWGGIATIGVLVVLGVISVQAPLAAFVAAFLSLQLATNIWGGPYAATIPDRVPPAERGIASAWMVVMTVLGTIVGAVVCGVLVERGDFRSTYFFIAAVLAVTLIGAFLTVYARGAGTQPTRAPAKHRRFFPPLRAHHAFYVVLVTRTLVTMGIYSVYEFFQYFLGDVVHVPNPKFTGGLLLGSAGLVGVPAALWAGRIADRVGSLRVVTVSSAAMALIAAAFVAIVYHPSWPLTVVFALLYGAANAAYQAVDWALAIEVLPHGSDAGKDMGIWHVSFVLPQMLAPGVTGLVLAAALPVSPQLAYGIAFVVAALWFALGTVFVARLRLGGRHSSRAAEV